MKKTALIASAAFILIAASVNAQTPTTPATTPDPAQQPVVAQAPVNNDKYNNWSSDTYKLQPMPEALTTEKIFPVIGKYQLTDKEGNASAVTITLDETNKGFAWIDGFPQGRIKANLMKSPATYKIPAQKIGEGKDAKDVSEGVLIYDKDANQLNACFGCTYNSTDPASVFLPASTDEIPAATATKSTKTAKAKVTKVKPVFYTGTKEMTEMVPAEKTEQ